MRTIVPIVLVAALSVASGALEARLEGQAPAAPARVDQPAFERAPDALERVTYRTRTLVGDDRLTAWKLALGGDSLGPTFLDAVVRADAAVVSFVEGSSAQQVSPQIRKKLDYHLTAEEVAALRARMGPVKLLTYRVDDLGDTAAQRRVFTFAKAMGADTIVTRASVGIAAVETLADELDIKVALVDDDARPAQLIKALEGRSKRLGVGIDTGLWAQAGRPPGEALAEVRERLVYVRLRDRSGRGAAARNVLPGRGVGGLRDLFLELNRLQVRPLALALDTTGIADTPADLFRAVEAFEETVQPAYGQYFTALSRSASIRRDLVRPARNETLAPDEVRRRTETTIARIEAAIPKAPYATPKKPRKLLVIDACLAGMSHDTIPHVNVMLESMGRITGAWQTELNNDLNNLKYPKIKEYDAVYLNDNVGELLPDPAVREGLARFVREGGGLGGVHGTPWASRNWDEFGAKIGAKSAPHRIEQGVMRVHDPASPIVKPFGAKPLPFREEYYRFQHDGPNRLRWEDVRVLLTVDLDDPAVEPRPWNGYKRPDNVYPVTWIRRYGQGRTFYCSLGHIPETFMTPEIVGHFLAGVQFLLGDLEADATPNPAGPASR